MITSHLKLFHYKKISIWDSGLLMGYLLIKTWKCNEFGFREVIIKSPYSFLAALIYQEKYGMK